jgi:hypothetical protein
MADGTLKVGTITNSAGSGNITIGSGVTLLSNVPAFEAYLGSDQTVTDGTTTKITMNTEVFDTAGAYDNSTNTDLHHKLLENIMFMLQVRGSTSSSSYRFTNDSNL